jgi:hypothetical protein
MVRNDKLLPRCMNLNRLIADPNREKLRTLRVLDKCAHSTTESLRTLSTINVPATLSDDPVRA